MSLLTCFPESLLYCTLHCHSDKISLLNAASNGMKHIPGRRGTFLTTYYRTYRADWRSDNRLLPSILVFFFFFARFGFFARFSFDSLPRCRYSHLMNLKDRATGSFWFRLSFQIDLRGIWIDSFLF